VGLFFGIDHGPQPSAVYWVPSYINQIREVHSSELLFGVDHASTPNVDESQFNEVWEIAKTAQKHGWRQPQKIRDWPTFSTGLVVVWEANGKVMDVEESWIIQRRKVDGQDGVDDRVDVHGAFLNWGRHLKRELLQSHLPGIATNM
jgi:hypothetical protein